MINAMRYTEDLEKAGMEHELARILVRGQVDMLNENMVTKIDFKELDFGLKDEVRNSTVALRKEISDSRAEFKSDLGELGKELRAEMVELSKELRGEMSSVSTGLAVLKSELGSIQNKIVIKVTVAVVVTVVAVIEALPYIKAFFPSS